MLTASNSLSFIRAPLAFLFLQENSSLRLLAVVLAMLTDCVDGYWARRSQSVTRFGVILDPAMDKFFVYFAMAVLYNENRIETWEMLTMLSRDFFLFLYTALIWIRGQWKGLVLQAIRWGKATTALQFIVLIGLVLDFSFPWYVYVSFIVMGWFAFVELFQRRITAPSN
jgi:CDP-diacylglycerol--glycerol-3-phosphate 3-phosphatidyltransferase